MRGDVEGVEADDLRINLWVAGADGTLWEHYWNGASWIWANTFASVPNWWIQTVLRAFHVKMSR